MVEVNKDQLSPQFYVWSKWVPNLQGYYIDQLQYGPKEAMGRPLELISQSIDGILKAEEGQFPQTSYNLLKQITNALFTPQEYQMKVYIGLKNKAKQHSRQDMLDLAERIWFLRRLFHQDKQYIGQVFANELQYMPQATPEEKLDGFCQKISAIVKVHVDQVAQMLEERV